jgi:meso-butanediol dehydrogenase/(S,S)-butanediol dehydrogenase/diacetyl reductase
MQRFEDKVVVVTGAASGIGAAAAKRFAREGASLVVVDHHRDKLDAIMADLPSDRTLPHEADVSDSAAVNHLIRCAVEHFGKLDVMVNNAGVFGGGDPALIDDEQWRRVLATDLDGVFYCCRAAIPYLKQTKGCIVNIASVSGLGGDWRMSPYNAAKGGVVNLTRALALDLGRDGVRVNAVSPSITRTGMTTGTIDNEMIMAKFRERIPLGRVCEPEEVAAVITFLASPDASFMTGSNVVVDGGVSASNGQPPQA